MAPLHIFKILAKYSDENVVEQWSEKCYFQYLSGMQIFTHPIPCVPTELITFSRQIGDSGAELILKENIQINRTNDDDNFGYAISLYSTI